MRRTLIAWSPPLAVLVVLLGAWEVAAQTGFLANVLNLPGFLVPAPSEIATSLWEDRTLLADQAWITVQEILAGFAVAVVLGALTAMAFRLWQPLRRVFYPLVVASQAIPIIIVAPIFVIWFGFGIWPKIALVALWCFFPVAVATIGALSSTPGEQVKLMRSLGAGRLRAFSMLDAPHALPALMAGAKIAAPIAVIGAVFGEWAGSEEGGLGVLILRDNASLDAARTFASVLLLIVMAIVLFAALAIVERHLAWWGSRPAPHPLPAGLKRRFRPSGEISAPPGGAE